jgi:Raf kinase inhibitor-like YbhB/YbcL family protein
MAAVIAGVACLVSGCGLVGNSRSSLGQAEQETMTVTSPMIVRGAMAPQYTCHGKGESPPIFWSGIPAHTKSLALVVDDSDAPITPRLYWIVFNISAGSTDIQPGAVPTGARVARNSTGRRGYDPPCPLGGPHQYRFTVYALNSMLRQPDGAPVKVAWSAIARHAIARGRLTAWARP